MLLQNRRRWLPVLLLVVVLHLTAIYWAFAPARKLALSAGGTGPSVTVELQLAPAPAVAPETAEQPVILPAEKPVATASAPQAAVSQEPAGGSGNAGGGSGDGGAGGDVLQQGTPGIEAPGTSVEDAMPLNSSLGTGGARGGAQGIPAPARLAVLQATPRYQVTPPPSAELHFDGHALSKGQEIHGSGQIRWQTDGSNFSIDGNFSVLFLSVLNFHSEGIIDRDYGVAPIIYTEKRLRRSATNTHFQRDRNLVSFSSSTQSYRRQGGEQDRASIIWQLAGIGRREGAKFSNGAEFQLVVAGVRDAEIRHVRVVGLEEIDSGIGKIKAWHLVHNRKPGSYEQTLDVWLAPEKDWYPVKLRYNERNGDYLELKLAEIRQQAVR
ncbi:MAG: putative PROLIN-rich signal peptide protein [Burkholderiaceae bacterium]|nr:putative PROLIN-rich signal peptide protein [Burkholderiaceae bacterium]